MSIRWADNLPKRIIMLRESCHLSQCAKPPHEPPISLSSALKTGCEVRDLPVAGRKSRPSGQNRLKTFLTPQPPLTLYPTLSNHPPTVTLQESRARARGVAHLNMNSLQWQEYGKPPEKVHRNGGRWDFLLSSGISFLAPWLAMVKVYSEKTSQKKLRGSGGTKRRYS